MPCSSGFNYTHTIMRTKDLHSCLVHRVLITPTKDLLSCLVHRALIPPTGMWNPGTVGLGSLRETAIRLHFHTSQVVYFRNPSGGT